MPVKYRDNLTPHFSFYNMIRCETWENLVEGHVGRTSMVLKDV